MEWDQEKRLYVAAWAMVMVLCLGMIGVAAEKSYMTYIAWGIAFLNLVLSLFMLVKE